MRSPALCHAEFSRPSWLPNSREYFELTLSAGEKGYLIVRALYEEGPEAETGRLQTEKTYLDYHEARRDFDDVIGYMKRSGEFELERLVDMTPVVRPRAVPRVAAAGGR